MQPKRSSNSVPAYDRPFIATNPQRRLHPAQRNGEHSKWPPSKRESWRSPQSIDRNPKAATPCAMPAPSIPQRPRRWPYRRRRKPIVLARAWQSPGEASPTFSSRFQTAIPPRKRPKWRGLHLRVGANAAPRWATVVASMVASKRKCPINTMETWSGQRITPRLPASFRQIEIHRERTVLFDVSGPAIPNGGPFRRTSDRFDAHHRFPSMRHHHRLAARGHPAADLR